MLVLGLLLLSHLANAAVELQNSILYDEEDFRGVDQITTDMCAGGCKVYATIGGNDQDAVILGHILIVDPDTQETMSVFDLSRTFMQDSYEKSFVGIAAATTVTIRNTNANRETAPLALWIVSAKSPYYLTAEVFEPLNLNRTETEAFSPITILSASPFTVTVASADGNGVFARAAGFDAIDKNSQDNCYVVMDKDFGRPFPTITLTINGPLLTLSFDTAKYPRSPVTLTGSGAAIKDFETTILPQQPTFLSSPGFVCGAAAHQVYRSTTMLKGISYSLSTPDDQEKRFNFAMDMNTNDEDPVMIYDVNTMLSQTFSGNFHDRTSKVNVFLQTFEVSVSFNTKSDNFYGMRVWTEDVGSGEVPTTSTPTTTSAPVPTTSSTDYRSLTVILLAIVTVMFA